MEPIISELAEQDFPIEKYWEIIKKRRYVLIAFALFTFIIMLIPVYRQKPVYEATGVLMIEREPSSTQIFTDYYANQAMMMDDYFNSQVRILKSRTLARSTLEELNLLTFKANKEGEDRSVLRIFRKEMPNISEEFKISAMVNWFLGSTLVIPIEETRLVEVRFRSGTPEMATRAVNTLINKFINLNLKMKAESTRLASEFLTSQIEELRGTLSQKERELQQYGEKKELFYLSDRESTVVDKFSDLNKAFTAAQIERVNKEASYRELRARDFENYAEVRNNNLIQGLKKDLSVADGEFKRKSQIFQDSYPEMKRLKSQIEGLQQRISTETTDVARKVLNAAESEYQSAMKKESYLNSLLDEQKKNVVSTNTNAIYYNSLRIEVDNMRSLLDYLVKKQKESLLTSRLEGLQTSNIKVVDYAEVPQGPLSSSKRRALLIALLLGIGGGLGLVFGLDYLDRSLSTPEDIERYLHLPALGMVPSLGTQVYSDQYSYYANKKDVNREKSIKEIELVNFLHTDSTFAEHYRNIRTSLQLSTPGEAPRLIAITSSLPSEGKTVTALNLAVSFSQLGKRVLLIDMDLRKPRIHKIFRQKNTDGVTSYLVGRSNLEKSIIPTQIPNLSILPSGPIPPNPVELLNSPMLSKLIHALGQIFDIIFIDSPPLVGIVDPILIGKQVDGMILVAWGGKTNRKLIERVKLEFEKFDVRLFGLILNRLSRRHQPGYYSSYSYRYGYRYGGQNTEGMRQT